MDSGFYTPLSSAFGTIGLLWQETGTGPRVHRVFLPSEQTLAENATLRALGNAAPAIAELGQRLQRFLEGEAIDFDLSLLNLNGCSEFQRRVLVAEAQIPRGWVSTYGRIAWYLDVPGGSRAVGSALAQNPFPFIIPCHRAIRSNGALGGFRGGVKIKRALLELEGVEVSPSGHVRTRKIYY